MDAERAMYNKKHMQASVSVAIAYGLAVGWWIGARMSHAGWLESIAFALFVMFAPAIAFSKVDAKYMKSE